MLGNSYGDYPKENTNGQGRTKECLWSGLASSHSLVCGGICVSKQAKRAYTDRCQGSKGVMLSCRDTPGAGEHRQAQGLVTE